MPPSPATTQEDPLLLVGQVLDGTYRIDALVGEGSFGIVYRALHLKFEELVAVKCLKIPWAIKADVREAFLAKFRDEAKLLFRLSKGNVGIVASTDIGATTTPAGVWVPYFVLEWLEGESLESALHRRRAQGLRGRSLADAMRLMAGPAQALAFAHEQRVAHRDIKPANFFVLRIDGNSTSAVPTIKLLDFGIAKAMEQEGGNPTLTAFGLSACSPRYAAPEQIDPCLGPTGPWSDVYSFAVVMVEILTDRCAVESADQTSLMFEILNPSVRPTPATKGMLMDKRIDRVFERALQVKRDQRYQNMGEFWSELVGAVQGDLVGVGTQSAVIPVSTNRMGKVRSTSSAGVVKRPSRRIGALLGIMGAVVGVVVACGVVLGMMFFDRDKGGIGASCSSNSDCQGELCEDGICSANCNTDKDCPAESVCVGSTSTCHHKLKVGAVWIGVIAGAEGWTVTHDEGLSAAKAKLGYVEYVSVEEAIGERAYKAVDDFVAQGVDVIIANSFDYVPLVREKAHQYQDTKFLHCSGIARPPNVASFTSRMEHAWYVAGRIAARQSKSAHIGFIASYNYAEVIRHLNAYTLGARKENPEIVVEVRWLGFWYGVSSSRDWEYVPKHVVEPSVVKLNAEQYLTAKLIDSGADIIAHHLDNQWPSRYVADLEANRDKASGFRSGIDVWTIANDNFNGWRDEDGKPYLKTLGSTYVNWGKAYSELLESIHRLRFQAIDYKFQLTTDPTTTVGFVRSSEAPKSFADTDVRQLMREAALMPAVFVGPIKQTGQRPGGDIPNGVTIDEKEWRNMCWFVEGVVERKNPNDPKSELVPAMVPTIGHEGKQGMMTIPKGGEARQPTQAPEMLVDLGNNNGEIWDCVVNSAGPSK